MAPNVVRDSKFRLFFFSSEEPHIHVHVSHPDGEAKFWLTPMVSLAEHTGLLPKQLREAQTVVEVHIEDEYQCLEPSFRRLKLRMSPSMGFGSF